MKPHVFNVYSSKIIAAIVGLEDVLASRCIAIPMRRADKKLPSIPPTFDGANLRHLLYSLALTHFQAVQKNYFERPELHTLLNRSDELWSPLVALAAFFEEQGKIEGLLKAISASASRDAQLSDGKALSEREEAVLQALELMTGEQSDLTWLKAREVREHVRDLMGYSPEQMGSAQWIGHILKRLQLVDRDRRKAYSGGQMYAIDRHEVLDTMRRHDVTLISQSDS